MRPAFERCAGVAALSILLSAGCTSSKMMAIPEDADLPTRTMYAGKMLECAGTARQLSMLEFAFGLGASSMGTALTATATSTTDADLAKILASTGGLLGFGGMVLTVVAVLNLSTSSSFDTYAGQLLAGDIGPNKQMPFCDAAKIYETKKPEPKATDAAPATPATPATPEVPSTPEPMPSTTTSS